MSLRVTNKCTHKPREVHVRCGPCTDAEIEGLREYKSWCDQRMDWYATALDRLRAELGDSIRNEADVMHENFELRREVVETNTAILKLRQAARTTEPKH